MKKKVETIDYLNKIKRLVNEEYIYIYSHEATYIDCSFDGHIIKGDVAGCITTRVDNFCTYVIEVDNNERK